MPANNEERAAYWHPHVEAWQASGVSARRFCTEHSLRYSQFLYWARKQLPRSAPAPASSFTRVVAQRSAAALGLQITLRSGVQIGGVDAGNVELLRSVLAQLGRPGICVRP
ncbi:MAG: hypothetical protein ACI87W_001343 [Halieaceae bacterium]|jgi:hypothetical protein